MNIQYFDDSDVAAEFIKSLQDENTVDVMKLHDTMYCVTWIKNKKYTAQDGKEYTDEVWTKEDGTMIACQDLTLEHARNIVRMILRQNREVAVAMAALTTNLQDVVDELDDIDSGSVPRVLH